MLISIEGINGVGKSTVSELVQEKLSERTDRPVTLTHEPTDSFIGECARRAAQSDTQPLTDFLLFAADRSEHVREIEQWLSQGHVVVSDRYMDSSRVFQHGVPEYVMEAVFENFPEPDLVVVLDLPANIATGRCDMSEKFEDHVTQKYARQEFLRLADRSNTVVVDAGYSPEYVADMVVYEVESHAR